MSHHKEIKKVETQVWRQVNIQLNSQLGFQNMNQVRDQITSQVASYQIWSQVKDHIWGSFFNGTSNVER